MNKFTLIAASLAITAISTPVLALDNPTFIAYSEYQIKYYKNKFAECKAERQSGLKPKPFELHPDPVEIGIKADPDDYSLSGKQIQQKKMLVNREKYRLREQYLNCTRGK